MARKSTSQVEVFGAYRLPATISVTPGCLGKQLAITISGVSGRATLPNARWDEERPVLVAPEFDPSVARAFQHRIDHEPDPWVRWNFWGSVSSWNPGKRTLLSVHLGAILLRIQAPSVDVEYWESTYGRGQVKGPHVEGLYSGIDGWFDRLRAWIEAAVDQDVDPENSLPAVRTPGRGLMLATNEGGVVSFPSSAHGSNIYAFRHQAINLPRLRHAVKATNTGEMPSDAHFLLRDARAALRRGGFRRAVIDAGSAVELTLASFNRTTTRVNTGGRATLGWYVDQPRIAAAASLPANLKHDLVTVRNHAIHQNRVPSHHETLQALSLAAGHFPT